jgi:hypothetical protein
MSPARFTQDQVRRAHELKLIGYSHTEIAGMVSTKTHPITKNQVNGWVARAWRMVKAERAATTA